MKFINLNLRKFLYLSLSLILVNYSPALNSSNSCDFSNFGQYFTDTTLNNYGVSAAQIATLKACPDPYVLSCLPTIVSVGSSLLSDSIPFNGKQYKWTEILPEGMLAAALSLATIMYFSQSRSQADFLWFPFKDLQTYLIPIDTAGAATPSSDTCDMMFSSGTLCEAAIFMGQLYSKLNMIAQAKLKAVFACRRLTTQYPDLPTCMTSVLSDLAKDTPAIPTTLIQAQTGDPSPTEAAIFFNLANQLNTILIGYNSAFSSLVNCCQTASNICSTTYTPDLSLTVMTNPDSMGVAARINLENQVSYNPAQITPLWAQLSMFFYCNEPCSTANFLSVSSPTNGGTLINQVCGTGPTAMTTGPCALDITAMINPGNRLLFNDIIAGNLSNLAADLKGSDLVMAADINLADVGNNFMTALMHAAQSTVQTIDPTTKQPIALEIVQYLLQQPNINLYAQDSNQHTASWYAQNSTSPQKAAIVQAIANAPLLFDTSNNTSTLAAIQADIAAGANINAQDSNGATPLMYAAHFSTLAVVQYLLSPGGANTYIKDHSGKTALDYAGSRTDIAQNIKDAQLINDIKNATSTVSTIQADIAAGANINDNVIVYDAYSIYTETPLILAVQSANPNALAITQYLLTVPNINVNQQDSFGVTPLIYATGAWFSTSGGGEQIDSTSNPNLEIVNLLLDNASLSLAEADNNGTTALMHAAASGPLNIVQALLAKIGQNSTLLYAKDKDGHTALDYAANIGSGQYYFDTWSKYGQDSVAVVRAIAFAQLFSDCNSATSTVADVQADIVAAGKQSANFDQQDSNGKTALMYAVQSTNPNALAIVKYLLSTGLFNGNSSYAESLGLTDLGLNIQDSTGMTALMYAAKSTNSNASAIFQALLATGLNNPTLTDKTGTTAIIYAQQNHAYINLTAVQQAFVTQLFSDLNTQTVTAQTITNDLQAIAASYKATNTTTNPADIQDAYGLTPLMHIAQYYTWDTNAAAIVTALLKQPMNINLQDINGMTALMYAAESGSLPLVNTILAMPGINLQLTSLASEGAYNALKIAQTANPPAPAVTQAISTACQNTNASPVTCLSNTTTIFNISHACTKDSDCGSGKCDVAPGLAPGSQATCAFNL